MTPTKRPARHAVYGELMWPEWNQTSESYGVGGQANADALLDAMDAETTATILRIVNEFVIESNDVGGIDANDLVTRLEQAGYPLPDDDADMTAAGPMSGQATETRNP